VTVDLTAGPEGGAALDLTDHVRRAEQSTSDD
jgi:hypothetical protein